MDPAGNKEDFNFETLNASVQASIDAKKQENAQARLRFVTHFTVVV